jgi:Tol biopolymer transport system component
MRTFLYVGSGFTRSVATALALLLALPLSAQSKRRPGSQLDTLPANIERLTLFGERADISPDSQRIAFMAKSFGDAMVVDLKTKQIDCLTCSIPGAVFLRVMHLASGDYVLIGPDHFENITLSRTRDNELWFLSKERGARPVKLGEKMSEGVAISKKTMKVAYSQIPIQAPEIPAGASRMVVADVEVAGGTPRLTNKKIVYQSPNEQCRLEAQDFYANDTKLTATCYEPKGLASVVSLDLATGAITNLTKAPTTYSEVEGIFPDEQYTTFEGSRQVAELGGAEGANNIDIWKLKMDGTGKDVERLTHFNDFENGKASNPVISRDGRFMAFQTAKTTDPAGVGYGILLYWFKR